MTTFRHATLCLTLFSVAAMASAQEGSDYSRQSRGTRWLERAGGLSIKVLVEGSVLGGNEVEVAEITFPAGSMGGDHVHGTNEIFYVLAGTLRHVVNGEVFDLEPGAIGIVRKGDTVAHKVPGDQPVKALVIWAPGGEVERLATVFRQRPVAP